jgi:hypothetical protein
VGADGGQELVRFEPSGVDVSGRHAAGPERGIARTRSRDRVGRVCRNHRADRLRQEHPVVAYLHKNVFLV